MDELEIPRAILVNGPVTRFVEAILQLVSQTVSRGDSPRRHEIQTPRVTIAATKLVRPIRNKAVVMIGQQVGPTRQIIGQKAKLCRDRISIRSC